MEIQGKSRKAINLLGKTIIITVLSLLSIVFISKIVESLNWRIDHDTPLFHYAAWMMNKYKATPYRDLFETSMPGTFIFHYIIGYLFGFGDAALQAVNVILLLMLLLGTYKMLRPFGWITAWSGPILFGLVYQTSGRSMTLQRDYLGVIPIVMAFMLIPEKEQIKSKWWRFCITGILFGLASTIKPHLLISAPVVIYGLWKTRYIRSKAEKSNMQLSGNKMRHSSIRKDRIFTICLVLIGVFSVWTPIIIWLIIQGAWVNFLQICRVYLPLYTAIAGTHKVLTGWSRVWYFLDSTLRFGGLGLLVLAGLFGWYHTLYSRQFAGNRRIMSRMIFYGAILYSTVYPILAGKFWPYHYMPMIYFMTLLSVLAFSDSNNQLSADSCLSNEKKPKGISASSKGKQTWAMIIILLAFLIQMNLPNMIKTTLENWGAQGAGVPPKHGKVDQIAMWLKLHIKPGDTVQPLDWTGGAIHAMLEAKAPLATRFMYDYHFFHHVSHPFIQELRKEFIQVLNQNPPRFMIEVDTDQPRITGDDTSTDFPELIEFIIRNYTLAFRGDGFAILERKG